MLQITQMISGKSDLYTFNTYRSFCHYTPQDTTRQVFEYGHYQKSGACPYDNDDILSPEAVRKGPWRSKIGVGVAIGLGIERQRDGSRTRETGYRNHIIAPGNTV